MPCFEWEGKGRSQSSRSEEFPPQLIFSGKCIAMTTSTRGASSHWDLGRNTETHPVTLYVFLPALWLAAVSPRAAAFVKHRALSFLRGFNYITDTVDLDTGWSVSGDSRCLRQKNICKSSVWMDSGTFYSGNITFIIHKSLIPPSVFLSLLSF